MLRISLYKVVAVYTVRLSKDILFSILRNRTFNCNLKLNFKLNVTYSLNKPCRYKEPCITLVVFRMVELACEQTRCSLRSQSVYELHSKLQTQEETQCSLSFHSNLSASVSYISLKKTCKGYFANK